MKDRVVLVTGANGALGRSVTRRLLERGARVCGVSRTANDADFDHPNFRAFPANLADPAESERVVQEITRNFGTIDGAVHVTGGFSMGAVHSLEVASWKSMMDVNLNSAFYLFRAVLPGMRERRIGRVVAIGSLAATQAHASMGAYVASKAALHTLVQTVALENARYGITANAILPETIDTAANRAAMPTADASKWVSPDAIADLTLNLLDDTAGLINGALIPIR